MNKDKRKGPSKPTPSLRNLIDEVLAQAPANPPPRMSSFPKSEYDKLCENLGGPADLGYQVKRSVFRRCCAEFPLSQVLPILLRFSSNEDLARRHWPWAAFAISQYKFETGERTKYGDDPSPTQIRDLLGSIERTAQNLRSALTTFQALAERLPDPGSPLRRAHLSWLNAFIAQAVDGHFSDEVNEGGSSLLAAELGKMTFIKQLVELEQGAEIARKRVNTSLLRRRRGQVNPALSTFLSRCGAIWKSLTGRNPSASKVAAKNPDFVIFVRTLAKIGNAPAPSRKQVETGLKEMRTPD